MPEQDDIIAFLGDPASYDPPATSVKRIETHGAIVFLAGDAAIKIKRSVVFNYMDFSTLERRRAALAREFELNAPQAPDLYVGVVRIIRRADGTLAVDEDGETVEHALVMRRFSQTDLLSEIARGAPLGSETTALLADAVHAYHLAAPIHIEVDAVAAISKIISELVTGLSGMIDRSGGGEVREFERKATEHLSRNSGLISARARAGFVRRCHGDLHLRNIVMRNGRPLMFDALEFSEELATIDTLYDLAFLLMDLDHIGQRREAAEVLNRYLWRSAGASDLKGLALLPLFLGLRAGVRAMVDVQRAAQLDHASQQRERDDATRYLSSALSYLSPPPPCLIAVGGFSGTGKTTLAAGLVPLLLPAPGALHLRSDLERKAMFGVEETERLAPETYTAATSDAVYTRVLAKADVALGAGHTVIVDAVFSKPDEREAIAQCAAKSGARFFGLWLSAEEAMLVDRVAGRTGDASDATPAVVRGQLQRGAGPLDWRIVDASGSPEATANGAATILREMGALPPG